jgi:hypothetical protein
MILKTLIVIHLLLGGIDWFGFTPDADELRWQARMREKNWTKGAIAYFQEEEEEIVVMQKVFWIRSTQNLTTPFPK